MTTTTVSAVGLRERIGEVLSRVRYGKERIIIERKGQPTAAIISMDDLKRLEEFEYERGSEIIRLARETSSGVVPFSEVARQFEATYGEPLGLDEGE